MVNTAQRFKVFGFRTLPCLFSVAGLFAGAPVLAQSSGGFATMPYVQNAPQPVASTQQRPAQVPVNAPKYRGPAPVTMFRATSPAPALSMPPFPSSAPAIQFVEPPPEMVPEPIAPPAGVRPYSISSQAQIDAAQTRWNPASLDPVVAPPVVTGGAGIGPNLEAQPRYLASQTARGLHRGPVRRILQDTRRAVMRDVPEGIADALPWVDRDPKNEPFDEVLDRVAADLHRASQADPAWALPAQREIRALSKRLDLLSEPPPLPQTGDESRPEAVVAGLDDRPFRPRPIWPGATGRPEAQVRPVTLITSGTQQEGPRATGVAARYVPAAEDDDGNPPQAKPRSRQRARGAPRRAARSR
jgi:hypothetical protein